MASLAETMLRGLQQQREMAIAFKNHAKEAELNAEIAKLQAQKREADLHERDLILRREIGLAG